MIKIYECPICGKSIEESNMQDHWFSHGCLCIIECSVNGECPLHGDKEQEREKGKDESK